MFEEQIAQRRDKIFQNVDHVLINEMKQILNEYAADKEKLDKQQNGANQP
jgi:hypothetical protein